ncbi:MAG TPA: D-sedoheptulose 7-phosphate isomerase [Chitinophagales bacterium]|nr:D-sedoheptulose 7-phosphate isomerase [Chitinophagales bacterium]
MNGKIKSIIQGSIAVKTSILNDAALLAKIETVAGVITAAFKNGHRVYLCGNGGSAADAQHIAAEFTGRFYSDREPLPAEALHVNTSFITAVANDYSYDEVYQRAVKAYGREGDVLIGLSTSGNSKNILLAQEEARQRGMVVVSFTGETGGKMKDSCDYLLNVPSKDTPRIQESHIMLGHIICQLVEEELFGSL